MNKEQRMVEDFHRKFGFTINERPTIIKDELGEVRHKHTLKELEELKEAMDAHDIIEIADALVDIQYFIYGTAVAYGIDLEPCFAEIHRSNMSKDRPDPTQYVDAKAVKGPNYSPPNLRYIFSKKCSVNRVSTASPRSRRPGEEDRFAPSRGIGERNDKYKNI